MRPEDLQTRQMTTQELRDFLERVSLHDPAQRVVKCALGISEPTTTVRRVAEPSTGRMRTRPPAQAQTERPDASPRTSALTAPLAISPMRSLPGCVLPPGGLEARRIAAVASPEPKARGMAFKREWVATGVLAMLAVGLGGAVLRSAGTGRGEAAAPELASALLAESVSVPSTRGSEGVSQAEQGAVPVAQADAARVSAHAQPLQQQAEPALAGVSEGQRSRPDSVVLVGPRRAVDLLLAGETRVALEAYRALAKQESSHPAYALAVKLLEQECLRGGGARCD